MKALTDRGLEVLVAVGGGDRRRQHDFRPESKATQPKEATAPWLVAMQAKLAQAEHRASYRVRQHTVEPVFGIMKHAMGFRHFLLRGHDKVTGEWQLLALAYNCKRLHNLQLA